MTPAEALAKELGARIGTIDGRRVTPMLCGRDESAERVLTQEGYHYELKLDGVRIVADKRGARVSLGYRKGRDASDSYPDIVDALATIGEARLVLDGEIVAFGEEGTPDFQRLGTRIQSSGVAARRAAALVPVVYVVFDVLAVGAYDVTTLAIEARKQILEKIVEGATRTNGHLRLQPVMPDGKQLFEICRERGLEGVVAKRAGSVYRTDERSFDWIKVKCELDADLIVVGWTPGESARASMGALDLAAYDGDRLVICGAVGSGLSAATIQILTALFAELKADGPVATGKYRVKQGRRHVMPAVVVSVRHMGLSRDGALKHPVFRGIRADLRPEECTIELAAGTRTRG